MEEIYCESNGMSRPKKRKKNIIFTTITRELMGSLKIKNCHVHQYFFSTLSFKKSYVIILKKKKT